MGITEVKHFKDQADSNVVEDHQYETRITIIPND
jgi:hypothetical protein